MDDIFNGLGVEVEIKKEEDFLVIKETLTRIGIASKTEKKLVQSCHLLHKQGRYAIMHFLEMFILDGKSSSFSDADEIRRNTITKLLEDWGLLHIIDPEEAEPSGSLSSIKIIPHKDKSNWTLVSKYTIGQKK